MASGSKTVIWAALIGNSLIAVTKFIAASISGSSAMFSEGIHSLVDTGNQILLLHGMKKAQKPPSPQFPFGHGKEIYFWSFIVAILIFALGSGISIYEGIHNLYDPRPLEDVGLSYIVLVLAILIEGWAWWMAYRAFNRTRGRRTYLQAVREGKDPSLFVVLFEDSAALTGLSVAFIGIFLADQTGYLIFDGLASIIIGLILGGTAWWLAYETKGLLIGESANKEIVDGIRSLLTERPEVSFVNEVNTLHFGPQFILVTLSAEFSDEYRSDDIEAAIRKIDTAIKEKYLNVKKVYIEAEARVSR